MIINKEIEINLIHDLFRYNILFLGKKEDIYNINFFKYNSHNYDFKLLSKDNIIYDIVYENNYAFAYNAQKFVDKDKYEYNNLDYYSEEISILTSNGNMIKFRCVALFKPYGCCGKSIYYHSHGN